MTLKTEIHMFIYSNKFLQASADEFRKQGVFFFSPSTWHFQLESLRAKGSKF